jgi:hypothetical protein
MMKIEQGFRFYLPGAFLIFLGVLFALFPMFFVLLLSAFLVVTGIGALVLAHRLRRINRDLRESFEWMPYHPQWWRSFEREFF